MQATLCVTTDKSGDLGFTFVGNESGLISFELKNNFQISSIFETYVIFILKEYRYET